MNNKKPKPEKFSPFSNTLVALVNDRNLEHVVTEALRIMKIPAKLCGYNYIRQSIMILMYGDGTKKRLVCELYKEVADKCGTSPERVERGIRHALGKAWDNGTLNNLCAPFKLGSPLFMKKPSGYEFIAEIANILQVYRNIPS